MTRRTLKRGKTVSGSGGLRVRLATADDEIPLQSLLPLADYKLEPAQLDALRAHKMATAIMAGLDAASAGHAIPVLKGLATATAAETSSPLAEELDDCTMAMTLPLVAVDRDDAVVGAAWSEPPEKFIDGLLIDSGVTGNDAGQIVLHVSTAVSRFSAVAVDPSVRGRGLGAALVRTTTKVLRQIGLHDLYGQIRESDHLEPFYEQLGFTILAPGQTLDLRDTLDVLRKLGINRREALDAPGGPIPVPGERLIHRRLTPNI